MSSPQPKTAAVGAGSDEPEAALRADRQRRTFLRMMSHELRTPLNSIIGFSDILSGEPNGPLGAPQYREYVEIIRTSGHRLLSMVNAALEIIRLESGGADLERQTIALDDLVEEMIQAVAGEARMRELRIEFTPPTSTLLVIGDARALKMVVEQLLQNAMTWSPPGTAIRVRVLEENGLVRLEIADEGPGVEPMELMRLMLPFEQGEDALSRRGEGAGLGWPLVRLLVREMAGEFQIDPGLGRGLIAKVTLRSAA